MAEAEYVFLGRWDIGQLCVVLANGEQHVGAILNDPFGQNVRVLVGFNPAEYDKWLSHVGGYQVYIYGRESITDLTPRFKLVGMNGRIGSRENLPIIEARTTLPVAERQIALYITPLETFAGYELPRPPG